MAFVPKGAVAEGDTVTLTDAGPRPSTQLKPAYRRWADIPAPEGRWIGVVDRLVPAADFDPEPGTARHVLMAPDDGDVAVLRVAGADGPVLGDAAYQARVASLQSALGT